MTAVYAQLAAISAPGDHIDEKNIIITLASKDGNLTNRSTTEKRLPFELAQKAIASTSLNKAGLLELAARYPIFDYRP